MQDRQAGSGLSHRARPAPVLRDSGAMQRLGCHQIRPLPAVPQLTLVPSSRFPSNVAFVSPAAGFRCVAPALP